MSEDPHTIDKDEIEPPPEAPEMERRIRLPLPQLVGVTLLSSIVLLAAFGMFGESRGTAEGRSDSLEISLEYPTRFRYKQVDPMEVLVTNRSRQVMDTITVHFDTSYIAGFSNVSITPSATQAWEVELINVAPGESRRVHVGLQAEHYGRHAGSIRVFLRGSDTARADVSTFVFP